MLNEKRSEADDARVAVHEAGHAGIGRQLYGAAIGGVTIQADEGYSGLCWGPLYDRRRKFSESQAPSLCEKLTATIPAVGESREATADIYLAVFHHLVDLCAGTESERLFCTGEPAFAYDDERQAIRYAIVITSSPAAAAALVAACREEAAALLKAQESVIRAIAAALRTRRTLDGAEVDVIIEAAVAARDMAAEKVRRAKWRQSEISAAAFVEACR